MLFVKSDTKLDVINYIYGADGRPYSGVTAGADSLTIQPCPIESPLWTYWGNTGACIEYIAKQVSLECGLERWWNTKLKWNRRKDKR